MNRKRGVAIELAVFAMVVATALGGLIATNLIFGANKTEKLFTAVKERAAIDYAADEYLKYSTKKETNGYTIKEIDGGFVVEKDGEEKLTVKVDGDKITEWKY